MTRETYRDTATYRGRPKGKTRPDISTMEWFGVGLYCAQVEAIDAYAKRNGMAFSKALREFINRAMEAGVPDP